MKIPAATFQPRTFRLRDNSDTISDLPRLRLSYNNTYNYIDKCKDSTKKCSISFHFAQYKVWKKIFYFLIGPNCIEEVHHWPQAVFINSFPKCTENKTKYSIIITQFDETFHNFVSHNAYCFQTVT